MNNYFVIGNPVDHSLSPLIHNYWFKKYTINGRYEKITATEATISSSAYIIGASASANQTLHLPTASAAGAGALLVIKDEYGTRASTSVTIKGNMSAGASTNLIDGQSSFILTGAMPAINLYSNGSNWQVF